MKASFVKLGFLGLLLVSASALNANAALSPTADGHKEAMVRYAIHVPMRTPYDGRQMIGWLRQNGFDVAGMNWKQQSIEVITNQKGFQFLQSKGIQGRVISMHDPLHAKDSNDSGIDKRYLDPDKTEAKLKELNAKYPTLTRLEKIGTSLQGRGIWALLLSTTPNANDPAYYEKPSIIFDGMHHAREIMTPEIVMDVAETTLAALSQRNTQAMKFLQRWNVWLVPMLNVDGNHIVWTSDAWWRKNGRADTDGSPYGVDINRNYPYRWNGCHGSSNNKGADDYHGASAASEPETQALMHLGQEAQPSASLSYHSYSELVLWPYGCDGDYTGDKDLYSKIGNELAKILPSDSGGGNYTPGTPWSILYAVDGDSMSFMHAAFGALSYTFEVNQEFQPSYDLRQPTLEKHRKAWGYFLNRIDSNMLALKVLDGKSGKVVPATTITISNIPHVKGEKPFMTNLGGNFFKVLDPGTYTVEATLPDGRKASENVTMQGTQAKVITIQ